MSVAFATREAEHLLARFGINGPEVNVRDIAAKLGLRIVEQDLDDDISGALITNKQGGMIVVHAGHVQTRQRFTIAHEIAHHVLGHHSVEDEHVHVDRGNYISLRSKRASLGVDPKEVEANWFAATLLMPAKMVQDSVRKLPTQALHDQHVERLASTFNVSEQAMTIRLSALGLL